MLEFPGLVCTAAADADADGVLGVGLLPTFAGGAGLSLHAASTAIKAAVVQTIVLEDFIRQSYG
jgi:hypothetical protein